MLKRQCYPTWSCATLFSTHQSRSCTCYVNSAASFASFLQASPYDTRNLANPKDVMPYLPEACGDICQVLSPWPGCGKPANEAERLAATEKLQLIGKEPHPALQRYVDLISTCYQVHHRTFALQSFYSMLQNFFYLLFNLIVHGCCDPFYAHHCCDDFWLASWSLKVCISARFCLQTV